VRGVPLVALLLLVLAPAAAARSWVAPVDGAVRRAFAYDGAAPFAAGRHRGVDLAARPGQVVRSPCAGRVSFAGRVPGHRRGVTVRCAGLAATVLDLRRVRVARGADVGRGGPVGEAAGPSVHLGARRAGRRWGYVDPLDLLGGEPAPRAPAVGPRGRVPREVPPPPAPAPLATHAPRRVPDRVPLVAWAGVALLAAGMPAGALWRRRRDARSSVAGDALPVP
jgi:Peptidase family M23